MKKITLLFLSILFCATYTLKAQKTFTGEIVFETRIEGTDDPNLLSSLENFTTTVSILGNKSKTVIRPNDMAMMTQIWNGDNGSFSMVIEIMGMGKFYKKMDAEQYKEYKRFNITELNFSRENEFKEILGYKCQKVIATITDLEDDSQKEIVLWVTKEIGSAKLNGGEFPGLEGFPLMTLTPLDEYCDECTLTQVAIKITPKKIKDVDFLLPDDARNIDEEPELKQMLGF
ncbi:MAG: DUF4412 domain-containing protein [Lentimicrobiaceae bacterium]|nr:DUF4412 domain-containing protein [Lentimicrobiaceae bacterium]